MSSVILCSHFKTKSPCSKLDAANNLYYKGPGSKGSHVHHRVRSDLISNRPFRIEGLPITCMSRAWLSELDEAEKEFYMFHPHRYDYSFPEALLKLTYNDAFESEGEDGGEGERGMDTV